MEAIRQRRMQELMMQQGGGGGGAVRGDLRAGCVCCVCVFVCGRLCVGVCVLCVCMHKDVSLTHNGLCYSQGGMPSQEEQEAKAEQQRCVCVTVLRVVQQGSMSGCRSSCKDALLSGTAQ